MLLLLLLTPCILYVGPYTNVLDLQLFPSMSHRHSAQLQMYGHTEANIEQTWRTVETVWSETSSSEAARAFILAYRVMEIIIKEQKKDEVCRNLITDIKNAKLSESNPIYLNKYQIKISNNNDY